MKTSADSQSDEGHDGIPWDTQGIREDGGVPGRCDERNDITLEIPAALYEGLLDIFRRTGCVDLPEFVGRVLRNEVRCVRSDNLEAAYSEHEIGLIRRLLHNVDSGD